MFPARPPPEGAKSVFAHNLHSPTGPSLPLTGTHGVAFTKHGTSITPAFSLFFLLLLPELLDNLSKHLPLYLHISSLRSGWKEISMHRIHICKRYLLSKAESNSAEDFCCKCSVNRYQTAQDSASGWNVLHLVGMTETHCHLNSPPLCETCEWFRCVCVRGREGERGWMGAVRVWSGHMVVAFAFNALQITCFNSC